MTIFGRLEKLTALKWFNYGHRTRARTNRLLNAWQSLYDSRKKILRDSARNYSKRIFVTEHLQATFHRKRFARDSLSLRSARSPAIFCWFMSRREDHSGKLVLRHPSSLLSFCERGCYAKQPGVITVRRSSTISKLLAAPLFYRRRGQRGFSQPILIFPINLPCPLDWNFMSFEEIVRTFCLASRRCSSARPLDRPGSCNYPIRGRARGR